MHRLVISLTLIFLSAAAVSGQPSGWKSYFWEEISLVASFPGEPEKIEESVNSFLGTGTIRRWTYAEPGVKYEVSVIDLPDLVFEFNNKNLNAAYDAACLELGGSTTACTGTPKINVDSFGEDGRQSGFKKGPVTVGFIVFLAQKRFYMATVTNDSILDGKIHRSRKEFLDRFLFAHRVDNEKTLKWGLPANESQKRTVVSSEP
ncbi:MAG: hypothetical protein IPM21_15020 [Acidobacteria bacterium]|nr:hypothetical protein [Acidobacteriota bacterium]